MSRRPELVPDPEIQEIRATARLIRCFWQTELDSAQTKFSKAEREHQLVF